MVREACLRLSQTEVLQNPLVKALNDACEEITFPRENGEDIFLSH